MVAVVEVVVMERPAVLAEAQGLAQPLLAVQLVKAAMVAPVVRVAQAAVVLEETADYLFQYSKQALIFPLSETLFCLEVLGMVAWVEKHRALFLMHHRARPARLVLFLLIKVIASEPF
jgi:hypothetical protein